jgi:predicted RNA polymerase sigma factor
MVSIYVTGDALSAYHLETAIAFEHCTVESFESIDWPRILQYYEWLCRLAPMDAHSSLDGKAFSKECSNS